MEFCSESNHLDLSKTVDLDNIQIVTNRQPFSHNYEGGDIVVNDSSGGLVAALNRVAEEIDADWLAWGDGSADFEPAIVNKHNTVYDECSPYDYSLTRIDLSEEQVRGYYYGYSNQALWPLCHSELEYVDFNRGQWQQYEKTNQDFAEALDLDANQYIWIHDYHFTLLPKIIRDKAGDEHTLVHFWHIPWPPVDLFETCPQREQILQGLIHNDALGFHTRRYRDNFLNCVDALLSNVRVDPQTSEVVGDGITLQTYVCPAGVDPEHIEKNLRTSGGNLSIHDTMRITEETTLAVSIDRLDYTKGILEKLEALEYALDQEYLGEDFFFLQIATKTREQIQSYREYQQHVIQRVDEINEGYGNSNWQPIIYTDRFYPQEKLYDTLHRADLCLISSRRDGLNLVAEEFVAASKTNPGILLLSEFAGANDVLDSPVVINPFDTQQFAEKITEATNMNERERRVHIDTLYDSLLENTSQNWIRSHLHIFGSVDGR